MIGERGGTTASLDEARELQEAHRTLWSATIRQGILEQLEIDGTFHADDLLTLGIPASAKNCVGAQVNAVVRSGLMVETGERRSTSDPAGHGRRSAVYRITQLGRQKLNRTEATGELDADARGLCSVETPTGEAGCKEPSNSTDAAYSAAVEPLQLFDVPASLYEDAA